MPASGTVAAALGGIGLFLLGMSMMTDGLKAAAGPSLRDWLSRGTRTVARSLAAGFLITALLQSSSAVTVATIGLVNAGLLGLGQAVWLVFGTNVGTTMTGWLVASVGLKIDVAALALPAVGVGMAMRLAAGGRERLGGGGTALAGFGLFFLGISFLQSGFADASVALVPALDAFAGIAQTALLVGLGAALTVLMQSSSAAMAVTLATGAGGAVPLEAAAAVVVGTNVGTTSTALFAALNATSAARRVAVAHIVFNVATAAIALAILSQLVAIAGHVVGDGAASASVLAAFHTLFNLLGVVVMLPLGGVLVRTLARMFASADEAVARPKFLDPGLASVPALAAGGLVREADRHLAAAAAVALDAADTDDTGRGRAAAAVRSLGTAIRAFTVRLGKSAVPADLARTLPDILRASQHADALAGTALPKPSTLDPGSAAASGLAELREKTQHCLDLTVTGGGTEAIRSATGEVEAAYESAKSEILSATAAGRIAFGEMEGALDAARTLRDAARIAWKAHRRLAHARAAFGSPDEG